MCCFHGVLPRVGFINNSVIPVPAVIFLFNIVQNPALLPPNCSKRSTTGIFIRVKNGDHSVQHSHQTRLKPHMDSTVPFFNIPDQH